MSVTVVIIEGPLIVLPQWAPGRAGARLEFEGIVREQEGDGTVSSLQYEAYEPMAQTQLEQLGKELVSRHGLIGMYIEHSKGIVPVGLCSFRLRIAAKHRKEALAAMDEFIDRLKRDIPIWKKPVWAVPSSANG